MNRRGLLALPLAPLLAPASKAEAGATGIFDRYFLDILAGYLENCARTSSSFAGCDFRGGTILPGAVGKSGKTYDSVTRMLPALAAWLAAKKTPAVFSVAGQRLELKEIVLRIFRHAFDPDHPDYWLPSPADKQQQRQVESSLVAWCAWLLRDEVLPALRARERANLQNWLASCTQVPVRRNNWAWFTAVNQAARLALAGQWKEFSGDEAWMLEDLKVLDQMALPGDGWYSDSLTAQVFDYYNFWVFASHFLYWNRMVGRKYPDWSSRFGRRLRLFLENAPYFFGSNGSHILFGRSLIYRWAVLTPLVLAYRQDMWPHSPGLLRRIVRGNLQYLWGIGAYDAQNGKLRETLSKDGTREVCESYIDNGHPYWGMQAFALCLIPAGDPFWKDPEEPLPVERRSFQIALRSPQMMLAGEQSSGHVRWLHAASGHHEPHYRDKYAKFVYSSHFPYCIIQRKDRCPWDNALVFRNPKAGECAGRAGVVRGTLVPMGVETQWWAQMGTWRLDVTSRILVFQEYEQRRHLVTVPAAAMEAGIEVVEGSYALGLSEGEMYEGSSAGHRQWARAEHSGYEVDILDYSGYDRLELTEDFGEPRAGSTNIVHARIAVHTLVARLKREKTTLESLHYASPRPMSRQRILDNIPRALARAMGNSAPPREL